MIPRPLHDLVLLRVLESESQFRRIEITEHGVRVEPIMFVVSTSDKLYKRALVVAVGPGRRAWRDELGRWHGHCPEPRDRVAGWAAEPTPIDLPIGAQVIYEDWLVRWHDGCGMWPGPGDLALVPASAIMCVVEREDAWIEWPQRFGAEPRAMPHALDPSEANLHVGSGLRTGRWAQ